VRVVVKVGSSSLLGAGGGPCSATVWDLGLQLRRLLEAGHQPVLVSSGAVASGAAVLGPDPQARSALAAIGQPALMELYRKALAPYPVAQLLVQRHHLAPPGSQALHRALETLLARQCLPVVNENDALSDPEMTIGDNDTVAAAVAVLVKADLLVLLSDVNGVYDGPPTAEGSTLLPFLDLSEVRAMLNGMQSVLVRSGPWGRGGMATKLNAALTAGSAGIPTVITSGRQPDVLTQLVAGRQLGTRVVPETSYMAIGGAGYGG
jgi:glutamate 5-kinase